MLISYLYLKNSESYKATMICYGPYIKSHSNPEYGKGMVNLLKLQFTRVYQNRTN